MTFIQKEILKNIICVFVLLWTPFLFEKKNEFQFNSICYLGGFY